jgi:hypothetical protein
MSTISFLKYFDKKYVLLKNKNSFQYLESEPLNVSKHGWSKKQVLLSAGEASQTFGGHWKSMGAKVYK